MPLIDIILPTYRRAAVLPGTLKSVQAQTFTDWRCFIAEDGQTPETRAAVAPFLADPRFTYLPGPHAGFPAAPRNRAIRQGAAPLIAFLDDDDLWLPEKLDAQVRFMVQHPDCALLGSNAFRWSGAGPVDTSTPFYAENPPAGRISFERLLECNIIINSTALVSRQKLLRSGPLNEDPRLALCEDYELWLRVASLGEVWIMADELAVYRDAPCASIREGLTPRTYYKKLNFVYTAALKGSPGAASPLRNPVNRRLAELCRRRLGRLKRDERQRMAATGIQFFSSRAKRCIISTGRLLGRLAGIAISRGSPHPAIFMIVPYYHTGGAERVLADILGCLKDRRPWIFTVRRSKNRAFKNTYARAGRLLDISLLVEKIRIRPVELLLTEMLTTAINTAEHAVLFGCNAPFFYDILPLISSRVKRVDLIHAFDGLEEYSLPRVPLLDVRVGINQKVLDGLASLYAINGIDAAYLEKVRVIENRTAVPAQYQSKKFGPPTVIYVGRGTQEKRAHLVGRIARQCLATLPDLRFILVGDLRESVLPEDRACCVFTGEIFDQEALADQYRKAHVLILTSSREGMPLVIMEAMAHGVVPVTTDVGGIGAHVREGANGFLISEQDERAIVAAFADRLQSILSDQQAYERLSRSAHQYALESFKNDSFCAAWAGVLTAPKAPAHP